ESLVYEHKKHTGELPLVGVNVFLPRGGEDGGEKTVPLMRSSDDEKRHQPHHLRAFQARHRDQAPDALRRLQDVARAGGNVFAELMETVRVCSLGQITQALFEVGGQYRRSM